MAGIETGGSAILGARVTDHEPAHHDLRHRRPLLWIV